MLNIGPFWRQAKIAIPLRRTIEITFVIASYFFEGFVALPVLAVKDYASDGVILDSQHRKRKGQTRQPNREFGYPFPSI